MDYRTKCEKQNSWITELNVKSKTLGRQNGRLLSRSNAWQKFF